MLHLPMSLILMADASFFSKGSGNKISIYDKVFGSLAPDVDVLMFYFVPITNTHIILG